jgi:hypothetical protein
MLNNHLACQDKSTGVSTFCDSSGFVSIDELKPEYDIWYSSVIGEDVIPGA